MSRCIAYSNHAKQYYRRAKDPQDVGRHFFQFMQNHGLVGDVAIEGDKFKITLPENWPTCFASEQGCATPNQSVQDALAGALGDFYSWHLQCLSAGSIDDPWHLLDERQAVRDILERWSEKGLIEYNLDHVNESRRGVRVIRERLVRDVEDHASQPRPRM